MFYTAIKKLQLQNYSQTWQQALHNKEVIKNSYHVNGDMHKAKMFVKEVNNYAPHTHFVEHGEHVIFSTKELALAAEPAYTF